MLMNQHEALLRSLQTVTDGAEALRLCAVAAEAILHLDREVIAGRVSLMNLSAVLFAKASGAVSPQIHPEAT